MSFFTRAINYLATKIPLFRNRSIVINDKEEERDSENSHPRKRRVSSNEESEAPSKKRSVLREQNTPVTMEGRKKAFKPQVITLDDENDEVVCVDDDSKPSVIQEDDVQIIASKAEDDDVKIVGRKISSTRRTGKIEKRKPSKLSIIRNYRSTYERVFSKPPPSASAEIRDTGDGIVEHQRYVELLRTRQGYDTPTLEGRPTTTRTPASSRTSDSLFRLPNSSTRHSLKPHFFTTSLSDRETSNHKASFMQKSFLSPIYSRESIAGVTPGTHQSTTPGPSYSATPEPSSRTTTGPSSEMTRISRTTPRCNSKDASKSQEATVVNLESEEELEGAAAERPFNAVHNEVWVRNMIQANVKSERERSKKIEEAKILEELHRNKSDLLLQSVHRKLRESLKIEGVPEPEEEEEEEEEEKEEEERKEPRLPELTPQMEREINDALRPSPPQQTLVEAFNISIKRKDMETLGRLNWLNDEIINYYFTMIMERGKENNYPSVYVTNTFFYSRLRDKGHAGVKRWTRKVDIFGYEMMLIPVHLGCHWTLASIDMKKKTVSYYDSMLGNNNDCLNALIRYLEDEMEDKKKEKLDIDEWTLVTVKEIPRQMNGSDCGMFTCKFAEYISRRAPITFSQEHMSFFRRLMVYEILHTKILLGPGQHPT